MLGKTQLTHDLFFGKGFSFTEEPFTQIDAVLAVAFVLPSNGADTVHFSLLAFSCGMLQEKAHNVPRLYSGSFQAAYGGADRYVVLVHVCW